jgi:hypothetical protein
MLSEDMETPVSDWLHYAQVIAALVVGIAALIALYLAHRSSEEAKRSAHAARFG